MKKHTEEVMNNELTTQQMIEALSLSTNENVADKCKRILSGESTIEEEKKFCGGFMYEVFMGRYANAVKKADQSNLIALGNYKRKLMNDQPNEIREKLIEFLGWINKVSSSNPMMLETDHDDIVDMFLKRW